MKKSKFTKAFIVIVSVILVVVSLSINVCATQQDVIAPRWVSIFDIDLAMSFDGADGNVTGTASKQSTANSIEGYLYLYKLVDDEWEFVDGWYNRKTVGTLAVSGDFTAESGVMYKVIFTVTAYTNNVPETETVETIKTCP